MSYMALYRKWRPSDFDEVKGQDAIVQTLRNQILYDRVGHAYLFCGTRGTGKTSIAKLFAKAVNCEHPVNGNPCNECDSCRSINEGNSLDVLEIDAASNNGVDHIREIREQVQYSPVNGRYKVYIIDEVHMLSSGAFNALLKTLEEPPAYVIFILATTEKHKIPVTILSRCQKYDFKRISVSTIADHLKDLMEKEQVDVEDKALHYIARAADGSMRDALSLLDQCIAFYLGKTLTYDNVLDVLGTVDTTVFSNLLRNILNQNTIAVLDIIEQIITEGRELSQFISDFLWYLRNLLLLKDQEGAEDSLDMSSDTIAALKEETKLIEVPVLLRFIRVLSDLSNQIRNATQKRILMEVGFIKLCKPQMETDSGSLLERLMQLEDKFAQGIPVSPGAAMIPGTSMMQGAAGIPGHMSGDGSQESGQGGTSSGVSSLSAKQSMKVLEDRFTPAQVADLKEIAGSWKDIVNKTEMPMQHFLKNARVAVSEESSILQLIFQDDTMSKDYFERDQHRNLDLLSEMVANKTGKQVKFECITSTQASPAPSNYIDLSKIHQEIIFE